MASEQTGRAVVSRDDIIAHLMLGFWIVRAPTALAASIDTVDVFKLVDARLADPFGDPRRLERAMTGFLRLRNRIAHHEPILFRTKHLIVRRSNTPRVGADLLAAVSDGLRAFERDAAATADLARRLAPPARRHLAGLEDAIADDLRTLSDQLAAGRDQHRAARAVRRAERRDQPEGRSPP